MKEKNQQNKIFFIIFTAVWLILIIADIIKPEADFSEKENRYLAKMPRFSTDEFIKGNYMSDIDTYLNDRFVLRDEWVNAYSISEYLLGKRELNGVYIGKDRLYAKVVPDLKIAEKNIAGMNAFAEYSGLECCCVLIPSASEIYPDKLPPYAVKANETELIYSVYNKLENVTPIRICEVLSASSAKPLYYKTDHHWTTYGAYLAYKEICNALYITAEDYNAGKISSDFNGTLYSKSGIRFIRSDTMEAFASNFENGMTVFDGEKTIEYDSIYFEEYLDKKSKYDFFLGQNQPLVTLHSTCGSGKKLLIFKDSFSHCLAPMLLSEYDEITLVDMRYIGGDIEEQVDLSRYSNVLFIYSTDIFTSQSVTARLKK